MPVRIELRHVFRCFREASASHVTQVGLVHEVGLEGLLVALAAIVADEHYFHVLLVSLVLRLLVVA